jgi:Tfp pilus assembly protein PilF
MEAETDFDSAAFDSAEDKLRTALVFSPDNIAAFHCSKTPFTSRKSSRRPNSYSAASPTDADDSSAYNNLGAVLAKQKRLREAISATRRSSNWT